MDKVLISICIPTYNGAQFIAEAMDSVIAQTYPNLEIVVSDDASTDDTLNIIETYKAKTKIPIHIYHHKPKGIGANWNNCIAHAKGDYIKFLFQDDVLMPECVNKMVAVLENDTQLGMVACKRQFILESGMDSPEMIRWIRIYGDLQANLNYKSKNMGLVLTKKLFLHPQFYSSPLNKIGEPSAIMFRKNILERVGLYREDLKQLLDYEFAYRVLKQYNIVVLQEELIKFRLHKEQTTQKNKLCDENDYKLYDRILYDSYFWLLHPSLRKRLFNKYHIIPRGYRKIKLFIKQSF